MMREILGISARLISKARFATVSASITEVRSPGKEERASIALSSQSLLLYALGLVVMPSVPFRAQDAQERA